MSGFRVRLRALWRNTEGNSLIGFALLLPALLGFSFAILEFSLVAFDFHRANEATRRIARAATMLPPLVDQDTLTSAQTVQCSGSSCTEWKERTTSSTRGKKRSASSGGFIHPEVTQNPRL